MLEEVIMKARGEDDRVFNGIFEKEDRENLDMSQIKFENVIFRIWVKS